MTRQLRNLRPTAWISTCECGKRCFPSRRAAKDAAGAVEESEHTSVFRCGEYWHWGHTPPPVVRGHMDRSEL